MRPPLNRGGLYLTCGATDKDQTPPMILQKRPRARQPGSCCGLRRLESRFSYRYRLVKKNPPVKEGYLLNKLYLPL
jgi:hypothetical protein